MQAIETKRLTLRNFTIEDGPALLKTLAQYQASAYAKYDHPWPTDPEKIKGMAKWFAEGDAYLAVCLKETNAFIGFACLNPVKQSEPCELKIYDTGYVFDFDFHGKGYATEACKAVLAYAFGSLDADRIITGTAERNLPSCKLLERIGMSLVSKGTASFQMDENGKPVEFVGLSYAVTKGQWIASDKEKKPWPWAP
jgi:RimJ/RimL family protein N-acetyltransferase